VNRFLNFALLILVLIAFFFGLNLGKQIQSVDTPVKTVYKRIVLTATPKAQPKITPNASKSATLGP